MDGSAESGRAGVSILTGDCRAVLPTLPSQSAHCVVTSPPYYGLRDYDHADQIGREATPAAYVDALTGIFRKVRHVLRDDGLLFLNLGDSYAPGKQLLGIPWRVAFAMQDDGWLLRSEIIWSKTFPKPERVKDRPTTSHERFFMFSKGRRYFYDAEAVAVPVKPRTQRRRAEDIAKNHGLTEAHFAAIRAVGMTQTGKARETQTGTGRNKPEIQALADEAKAVLKGNYHEFLTGEKANLRTVWTVGSSKYPGVHTAVFPPALIEPCIKAGCPVGGTVLDPFGGAGTTALVAAQLGRRAIVIELNPDFARAARDRLGPLASQEAA